MRDRMPGQVMIEPGPPGAGSVRGEIALARAATGRPFPRPGAVARAATALAVVAAVGAGLAAASTPTTPSGVWAPGLESSASLSASPAAADPQAAPDAAMRDYRITLAAAQNSASYYEALSQLTAIVPLPGHYGEAANATAQSLAALAASLRAAADTPGAGAVGIHPDRNLANVRVYPIFYVDPPVPGEPGPVA